MIDVIIPVYGGEAVVRRCLQSVWSAQCAQVHEIVAVDDCSPEPALSAWLGEQAAAGRITLLRNAHNLGFVGSVNRAMALHGERDVVLLNSDTEVANDWLDRLAACAERAADIGTVTPFSNNATICSYPYEGWSGEVPGTLGLAALDALVARTNAGRVAELPTAVGFCMFIRRACLDAVGLFDVEHFGRGYGEENDFCRRALAAGWRNVLCADVFVYHHGGVSFGAQRSERVLRAGEVLLDLHPDYLKVVRNFVARDPLRALRDALDQARAASGVAEFAAVRAERAAASAHVGARPVQLHICHSWGGGIERWIEDFCAGDLMRRNLVLRSRSDADFAAWRLELCDPLAGAEPLMVWPLATPIASTALAHAEYAAIVRWVCAAFEVQAVLVSSLIGHALDVFELGLPTALVLHDFYPFCPALYTFRGGACTQCTAADLHACLHDNPANLFWQAGSTADWLALRAAFAATLTRTRPQVAAPSQAAHARWCELFPPLQDCPFAHLPHGLQTQTALAPAATLPAHEASERLRVVVVGRLAPHKGLDLLRALIDELSGFADLILLGSGAYGVEFAGRAHVIEDYAHAELPRQLADLRPHCALLLSAWPETYNYILSELQTLGLPVAATRIGAFAERIEHGETGWLMEATPAAVLAGMRTLAAAPDVLQHIATRLQTLRYLNPAQMVAAYHALLPLADEAGGRHAGELLAAFQRAQRNRDEADKLARWATDLQDALLSDRAAASARAAALEAENLRLRTSASWRLTALLRSAYAGLRRIELRRTAAGVGDSAVATTAPAAARAPGATDTAHTRRIAAAEHDWMGGREAARRRVRAALEVPASVVLVLADGKAAGAGMTSFVRLAGAATQRSNRVVFVWLGEPDAACVEAQRALAGALLAARRLFFVSAGAPALWQQGADLQVHWQAQPDTAAAADLQLSPTANANEIDAACAVLENWLGARLPEGTP